MEVEFKYLRPSILQKVSLLFDSDDTVSQSSFACFLLPNRTEIQLRSYLVVASFPRLPLPPPPPAAIRHRFFSGRTRHLTHD